MSAVVTRREGKEDHDHGNIFRTRGWDARRWGGRGMPHKSDTDCLHKVLGTMQFWLLRGWIVRRIAEGRGVILSEADGAPASNELSSSAGVAEIAPHEKIRADALFPVDVVTESVSFSWRGYVVRVFMKDKPIILDGPPEASGDENSMVESLKRHYENVDRDPLCWAEEQSSRSH